MKANEFIKKHGWNAAKKIVRDAPEWAYESAGVGDYADKDWSEKYPMADYVLLSDLKLLVESYQLIQSYKGCGKPREHALSTAKFTLNHFKSTRELEIEIYGNNDREVRLEQAILDVESCQ